MKLELKIIDLLSRNPENGFTINGIATALKQFYSFVNRVIGRMAEEGVLLINKVGKAHQCSLNLNSEKTRALIVLAEIEKKEEFYTANKKLKIILEDFKISLKETNSILVIVLFGSYAKGTAAAESDMDLLIIAKRKFPVERAAREIYAKYGIEISPMLLTEKEFKEQKNKEVLKEIIKNHCILSGAEKFIKLVL